MALVLSASTAVPRQRCFLSKCVVALSGDRLATHCGFYSTIVGVRSPRRKSGRSDRSPAPRACKYREIVWGGLILGGHRCGGRAPVVGLLTSGSQNMTGQWAAPDHDPHSPDCGREGSYRDTITRPLTDLPVAGYPLVPRSRRSPATGAQRHQYGRAVFDQDLITSTSTSLSSTVLPSYPLTTEMGCATTCRHDAPSRASSLGKSKLMPHLGLFVEGAVNALSSLRRTREAACGRT